MPNSLFSLFGSAPTPLSIPIILLQLLYLSPSLTVANFPPLFIDTAWNAMCPKNEQDLAIFAEEEDQRQHSRLI